MGEVFALISLKRDNFASSKIVVGNSIKIIKPAKEENWSGIHILSTKEQRLFEETNWLPYTPPIFPELVIQKRKQTKHYNICIFFLLRGIYL